MALIDGQVAGALLGAIDTKRTNDVYEPSIQKLLLKRILTGHYGWPGWLWSYFLTERVGRKTVYPKVDLTQFPAHLHIGLLSAWRRKGIGTALMQVFESYLKLQIISGYHLYVSSFNPPGLAFYHKIGLHKLGQFQWRFHSGEGWQTVTETIYGRKF